MRHNVAERKLGRKTAHRKALFANLLSALIFHDRIETTLPKARELKPIADKIVTLSKKGSVPARRRARAILRNRQAVFKAFGEFSGRFADRQGGYTRILKLGYRHGDSAPMAIIEYLSSPKQLKKEEKETKKTRHDEKKTLSLRDRVFRKKTLKTSDTEITPAVKKTMPRRIPQQRSGKEK